MELIACLTFIYIGITGLTIAATGEDIFVSAWWPILFVKGLFRGLISAIKF